MSDYFNNFNILGNGSYDLVQFVSLKLDIVDISLLYTPIIWKDGDVFSSLSNFHYGNPELGWTIWRVNHLAGEWDSPLTENFLRENSIDGEEVHHFEFDGKIIDKNGILSYGLSEFTFSDLENTLPDGVIAVSNVGFAIQENDKKRNMRIINPDYINKFVKEFTDVLTGRTRIGILT